MAKSTAQTKIADFLRRNKLNSGLTYDELIPVIAKGAGVQTKSVRAFYDNGGMEAVQVKGRAVPEKSAIDAIREQRGLEAERIMAQKQRTPEMIELAVED